MIKFLLLFYFIFFFTERLISPGTSAQSLHTENLFSTPVSDTLYSEINLNPEPGSLPGSTTETLPSDNILMLGDGTAWREKNSLNNPVLYGMFGVIALGDIAGYFRLKDLWYSTPTGSFHGINWKDDFAKYKWMDKMGHFLHSYFATDLFARGYRLGGISGNQSVWYGALTGWLWMLQIEVADGFFEEWGFSYGDLFANTLGTGYSVLQQFYPDELGGIQPKISYQKSEALRHDRYVNNAKSIIDDYEGMTFWLAVNIRHYMPRNIQKDFPAWLAPVGIALGYSAKGIGPHPQGGHREILLGLDYDLRKIPLGENSWFINFLKNELNIIRLPLPAVKLEPEGIWYGFYF